MSGLRSGYCDALARMGRGSTTKRCPANPSCFSRHFMFEASENPQSAEGRFSPGAPAFERHCYNLTTQRQVCTARLGMDKQKKPPLVNGGFGLNENSFKPFVSRATPRKMPP